jgi:hypothetical protein
MRGAVRLAQDHYDAAQVLHLFLTDLGGQPPARPSYTLMDGRSRARDDLYERAPTQRMTRDLLQDELVHTGLYPHGVHLVGEGKSEQHIVQRLVSGLLGRRIGEELGFTDLGGAGMASRLPTMVGGFKEYALRTIVIVDDEGKLAEYVTGLVRSGDLPEEDVLQFKENLEESNFEPQEMLDVLIELAGRPPEGREPVTLTLPLDTAEGEHEKRRKNANASEPPGFAGTLLDLAEDPQHGAARISKPEFAVALADRMLADLEQAWGDKVALTALYEKRPLLKFVLERVIPVFEVPSWR